MTTHTDHDLPPLKRRLVFGGGHRALYGGFGLWVRPAAMFAERGVFEGMEQPRFARHGTTRAGM